MARTLKAVDVVLVGFGWTGAILGQELTEAGLEVLALERGGRRDTNPDFAYTHIHDELKYGIRYGLMAEPARDTVTFRNTPRQDALPMRHLGSFLPGTGVGGAGVHWNGQTWRFLPTDFTIRSHSLERYGKTFIPDGMTIQDWGVTYDELEAHYDRFEYLCGVSGKAGNLKGVLQPGGNPFEGWRSRDLPNPPQQTHHAGALFAAGARSLGYQPFPQPSANASRTYVNPLGVRLGPCNYCGYCERFGCEMYAKASPQTTILPVLMKKPGMTLRSAANVTRINLDSSGRRARSVTYLDAGGVEYEQPADLIVLSAFILQNVKLLLNSGIGKPYDYQSGTGVIGKNYAYQITSGVDLFFDDKMMNPFIGAGALGMIVDEFNGDNFDHSGVGFIGGGYIGALSTGVRPIEHQPVPEGTPAWGAKWKKALKESYPHYMSIATHGSVMSYRDAFLDRDPVYRDAAGMNLVRMTFDFHDNEHRMSDFLTARATAIAEAMRPSRIKVNPRRGHYTVLPYQTTHNTGGTIMGTDPRSSALNTYLQMWDVPNLFVMGAGAFPQNPGYNPTGTIAALAYRSAEAIRTRYLKAPGPLVDA